MNDRRRIFVSYRRDDCEAHAGWLAEKLEAGGAGDVFLDVAHIGLGEDFAARIRTEIEASDVVLVLIGSQWLTLSDRDGRPRLSDPDDWVQLEIKTALERDIPVVPVLVERAQVPSARDLPPAIRPLAHRHGIALSAGNWAADVERLIALLPAPRTGETGSSRRAPAAGGDRSVRGDRPKATGRAAVETHVQQLTGLDADDAAVIIRNIEHQLDLLVTDDFSVVAPPLVVRRLDDPVTAALWAHLLENPGLALEPPDDVALAQLLGITEDVTRRFPVAWVDDLLVGLLESEGVDVAGADAEDPEVLRRGDELFAVLEAWLSAWSTSPPLLTEYGVTALTLSPDDVVERLQANVGLLASAGLEVELVATRRQLSNGYTADLVCRATAGTELLKASEWVAVTIHPHMADLGLLERLQGVVAGCARDLGAEAVVHGLLIADGTTVGLQNALTDGDHFYLSLSGLGFRSSCAGSTAATGTAAVDRVRQRRLRLDVLPEEVMCLLDEANGPSQERARSTPVWTVDGHDYTRRADANKALAALLGTYTRGEWQAAQREHGLR